MPPKPKALTAARRGVLLWREAKSSHFDCTLKGLPESFTLGPGFEKLAVGGRLLFWKESRTFIIPAAPAAVSRWPIFDFTEPSAHWPALQPRSPQRVFRLSTSTGSPAGVPVAWHSI